MQGIAMTELQKKIDQEVGQDTENTRVTYLKYVNYGRQIAVEELVTSGAAVYTQDQFDHAVANAAAQAEGELATKISAIMAKAAYDATEVEIEEKSRLAEMEKLSDQGPIKAEMVQMIKTLITDIDKKHSVIIKERDVALEALLSK